MVSEKEMEIGKIISEAIEEEGIAPGKVIVYRQGSQIPKFVQEQSFIFEYNSEEDRLLKELYAIAGI